MTEAAESHAHRGQFDPQFGGDFSRTVALDAHSHKETILTP